MAYSYGHLWRGAQPGTMPPQSWLLDVFQRVDKDRSGCVNAIELQMALSNATWPPFNLESVRLMVGMFDSQQKGTLNFNEFQALWKYITDWQNTFLSYDREKSGFIDTTEMKAALTAYGYRLSDSFYAILIRRFDRYQRRAFSFDDFIQACLQLQITYFSNYCSGVSLLNSSLGHDYVIWFACIKPPTVKLFNYSITI